MSFTIQRLGRRGIVSTTPLLLALGLLVLPSAAQAQSSVSGAFVSGDAYGVFVTTPLLTLGPTPQVTLPASGGSVSDDLLNVGIPGLISSGTLEVSSSGTRSGTSASSQSRSVVEDLDILAAIIGSIVSADVVDARTSCTLSGGSATCSAAGSSVATLVVAGTPIPVVPPPNTVIGIPGIATVTLNEQISGGDGITSKSLTVNMIRVTLLNLLGPPLADIVVGHSHSDVGRGGICTGSGTACDSAADCPAGEGCCGDASVDASAEQCDAGADNGEPGSGCTASCEIGTGVCTGSGEVCASEDDCPAGEGCCGDGVVDAPAEDCDGGANCTASCQTGTGMCTGSGAACETPADCPAGQGCCGNGIVEAPEECDGTANCTASCGIGSGVCTGSGAACDTAAECPAGQGCCGNSIIDVAEECDDGNTNPNDQCSATCTDNGPDGGFPLFGCEGVPAANVSPAFVRNSFFRDTNRVQPGFERWRSRGDFNLPAGANFDPDSQTVRVIFSQATLKYNATLAPGSYAQSGSSRLKYTFRNPNANTPGAAGLKRSVFRQKLLNKYRFTNEGIIVPIPLDTMSNPIKVRHTIRVHDLCITAVATCTRPKPNGAQIRCRSLPG